MTLVQHPLAWAATKRVSVSKEFLDCFIQIGRIPSNVWYVPAREIRNETHGQAVGQQ